MNRLKALIEDALKYADLLNAKEYNDCDLQEIEDKYSNLNLPAPLIRTLNTTLTMIAELCAQNPFVAHSLNKASVFCNIMRLKLEPGSVNPQNKHQSWAAD